MSERGSGFGAFLLGVVAGAVLGYVFAPEAGEELRSARDLVKKKAGELRALVAAEDTKGELRRRLQAARRRRRGEQEDEPVA